jgi:hypothetical protein
MRGGEYATARRSRVQEDALFILARHAQGVPMGAIARMVGRSTTDVARIVTGEGLIALERPEEPVPPPVPRHIRRRNSVQTSRSKSNVARVMPARARDLVEPIARYYGVTLGELVGGRRNRALATIRQEAYAALYATGRFSFPLIGSYFGGRDHSSIRHGVLAHMDRASVAEAAE